MSEKYTVEEYTFQLPSGTTFTSRLEANNSTTLELTFSNGMKETFNSGTFLTCSFVSAAAYLKVNFVMKGKFPDFVKFEVAKWVAGVVGAGCTFAVSTWETYQNDGPSGGNEETGGGRGPNDTGGSNPMPPGYNYTPGEDPKKGYLEIKPASVDPGLNSLSVLNALDESSPTSALTVPDNVGSDAAFVAMMNAVQNVAPNAAKPAEPEAEHTAENILGQDEFIEIIGVAEPAL